MELHDQAELIPGKIKRLDDFSPDVLARLDSLDWQRLTGNEKFDYPIDYSIAVIRADREANRLEFVAKWAPNAYCHFHRHLGKTASLVLQGEQHIVETSDLQTIHKIRKPGFRGQTPPGETHMEYGGAEGAVVLFIADAVDGIMFDVLANDGTVLASASLEDLVLKRTPKRGGPSGR